MGIGWAPPEAHLLTHQNLGIKANEGQQGIERSGRPHGHESVFFGRRGEPWCARAPLARSRNERRRRWSAGWHLRMGSLGGVAKALRHSRGQLVLLLGIHVLTQSAVSRLVLGAKIRPAGMA